jgi:hypothetical protein
MGKAEVSDTASESVALAGGRLIAEEAGARKDRERRLSGVILQAGALLDLRRVDAKEVDRETGVPHVLHLVLFLLVLAVEGILRTWQL